MRAASYLLPFLGAALALIVAGCGKAPPPEGFRLVEALAPPAPAPPLPEVRGPVGRPLVVVDAGHGGHDPGAVSAQATEKQVTLAAARAAADAILRSGRLRVALTRSDDRFQVLEERFGIARRLGADLFVSLHADASPDGEGAGASIYTLAARASDADAARTAARENRGSGDSDWRADPVQTILADLTRRETAGGSQRFAGQLIRAADGRVPLRRDPRRAAALAVLRAPDVPSVLFEMGYLSDGRDRALLTSAEGIEAVGETVRVAAERHLADRIVAAQAAGAAQNR